MCVMLTSANLLFLRFSVHTRVVTTEAARRPAHKTCDAVEFRSIT